MLYSQFGRNFFVDLLCVWCTVEGGGLSQSYPCGGICYYISPPGSLASVIDDPIHAVIYITFTLGSCAFISTILIELFGISAKDVCPSVLINNIL